MVGGKLWGITTNQSHLYHIIIICPRGNDIDVVINAKKLSITTIYINIITSDLLGR